MSADLAAFVGRSTRFSKTVGESDVYLFAGITGDLSPNHVDEEAMARTSMGRRVAHGVLTVGFMSTASTRFVELTGEPAVSVGYDGVRFLAPVFIGDTIEVTYTVTEVEPARRRTIADVTVHTRGGELCAVARHILKFID